MPGKGGGGAWKGKQSGRGGEVGGGGVDKLQDLHGLGNLQVGTQRRGGVWEGKQGGREGGGGEIRGGGWWTSCRVLLGWRTFGRRGGGEVACL